MKKYLGLNSETDFNFDLRKDFSGVGMIRGENLCVNKMQYFLNPEFCEYLYNYLCTIANEFKGSPVWYRTADLTPHQINLMDGCDAKINEAQYLIGLRGVRRNLTYPEAYKCELDAFCEAYKKNNNLGLLIPFVATVNELKEVKKFLTDFKYDGKLGVMIEISSMVFMLDEINNLGIDNYTLGVNDLTTSLLCAHRDLPIYSVNDDAVLKVVRLVTDKVHSFSKEITLAGYLNKDIVDFSSKNDIDIVNIHYNEIPKIYDVPNPDFYTNHYDSIKMRYKTIKNEKQR